MLHLHCFIAIVDDKDLSLKPIQDGPFRVCPPMGEQKYPPLPKICHKDLTMMKFSTVIPYLKNIQKC